METTDWCKFNELAEILDVADHTIRNCYKNKNRIKGMQIERKLADKTPVEVPGRPTKFLYRAVKVERVKPLETKKIVGSFEDLQREHDALNQKFTELNSAFESLKKEHWKLKDSVVQEFMDRKKK